MAGDDLGAVLRELVRGPGVEGQPLAVAEVAGQSGRGAAPDGDGEALAVRGGQGAAAPGPAQGLAVLEVDDRGDGRAQGLLPQVPVGAPGQPAVGQLGDLGHRGRAEVAGLRQDRGVEVHPQVLGAGLPPAGVLEVAGEVGPAIDLDEQVGQVDPGEVLGDLLLQARRSPRAAPRPRAG